MIPTARPHGPQAYNEFLTALHVRYGGDSWPLADAVGAASVASLKGVTPGTPSVAGLTFGSAGPFIHGQPARACTFAAASTGLIDFGNIYNYEYTQAFSGAAWIKPGAAGATQGIFAHMANATGNKGWAFYVRPTGILGLMLRNHNTGTVYALASSAAVVTDGAWHHVAFAYTGSGTTAGMTLFVDGVADTVSVTDNLGGNSITATTTFQVGAQINGLSLFNGAMLYPSVIPAVLSAADILTMYTLGKAGQ